MSVHRGNVGEVRVSNGMIKLVRGLSPGVIQHFLSEAVSLGMPACNLDGNLLKIKELGYR